MSKQSKIYLIAEHTSFMKAKIMIKGKVHGVGYRVRLINTAFRIRN